MFRWFSLIPPMFALACASKPVALDQAIIVASSDPTVVGTVHESVGQLVVDDERLYWNATPSRDGYVDYGNWALRGCLKQDCAATVITYDAGWSSEGLPFGVVGDQLYWFRFGTGNVIGPGVSDQYVIENMTLVSRPVAGGATRTLTDVDLLELVVFDTDGIYVSTQTGLYAIPFSQAAEPPQPIGAASVGTVTAIAAQGDYVYWTSGSIVPAVQQRTGASLCRTRKDGSGTPETLIGGLELDSNVGLALDSSYVYWTQDALSGSVDRCPLAGCTGAPEVVTGPVRSPTNPFLTGDQLYFRYQTDAYRYALSSCTLGQCTLPQPIIMGLDVASRQGLDATAALAIDDQYLYTVTTDQNLDPQLLYKDPVAQIRRFPK